MNLITIKGRLVRNPELKTSGGGMEYCKFTVAVDRRRQKDKEKQTDFFDCTAFGNTGVAISKYFEKGKEILLTGRMESNKTEKDGVKHTWWGISVDTFEFCGGSVIDFVMEHEQCNYNTAVRAIDSALHLGLLDPKEDPQRARMNERVQIALDNFVEAIYAYVDIMIKFIEVNQERDFKRLKELEALQFGHADQLTADDYTFLMTWEEDDQYNTYRAEKFREFKEEVAAWRRTARGQTSV